jgi:hypothetical protein
VAEVNALQQARTDAEHGSHHSMIDAQTWALIAIAEQLLKIRMLLKDVSGDGEVLYVQQTGPHVAEEDRAVAARQRVVER